MADDLSELLSVIDGEGPSPEFVAELRERIMTEADLGSRQHDRELIDLEVNVETDRPRRLRWLVAAAAGLVMVAGAISLGALDRTTEVDTTTDQTATTIAATSTTAVTGPHFVPDATPVPFELPAALNEGTHLFTGLGTPFSVTIAEQPVIVQERDRRGVIVVTHPATQGPGDPTMTFSRATSLPDPAQPLAEPMVGDDRWPASDFAGWLDNIGEEVIITDRVATSLGNRRAVRADLVLGEVPCVVGSGRCVFFAANGPTTAVAMYAGVSYRIWVVEQGEEPPIVVSVSDRNPDAAWFDDAEEILATLAFGDTGPNPIVAVGPGRFDLPFLGGVNLELPADSLASQLPGRSDRISLIGTEEVGTDFLVGLTDLEGNQLTTIDALLAVLANVEPTELDPTTVAGYPARTFEFDAMRDQPMLGIRDGGVWRTSSRSRFWVVDHPDRGLVVITAEAYTLPDLLFPRALEQTEALVASLEFVDR